MPTSAIDLLATISALICVGCTVACAFLIRRGADAELKSDVGELAAYVDKLARESRREKMRRVRAGEKVGEVAAGPEIPVPPQLASGGGEVATVSPIANKAALRAAWNRNQRGMP